MSASEAVPCPICRGNNSSACVACNGSGVLTSTESPLWRRVYPGCYETYVAAEFEIPETNYTFRGPVRLVVRRIPEWPRVDQWANEAWLMTDEAHGGPEQLIRADDGPEPRRYDAMETSAASALAGWSRDRQLGWCLRA